MNIIKSLQARIAKRLTETKNPCKVYKTMHKAEQVGEQIAEEAAQYFGVKQVRYLVIYIPQLDKYTPCFDMTLAMTQGANGYLGYIADKEFYTF